MVWTGRLSLAWTVTDDTFAQRLVATLPVIIFVALAVVTAVFLVRDAKSGSREQPTPPAAKAAMTLAVWTIGYWLVRLPMILLASHPGGFIAVHTVLAVVSWTAAAIAARGALRSFARIPKLA